MKSLCWRRVTAFVMAFIMTASVLFQSDYAILGLQEAWAAVASATDAPRKVSSTASPINLETDDAGYYIQAISSQTYNGSAKTPTVYVYYGSGTKLDSSKYDVSYSDNTNAGTATATVTGKESEGYTGSISKTFTISKKSITVNKYFYIGGTDDTANNYDNHSKSSTYYNYTYAKGKVCPDVYIVNTLDTTKYLVEGQDYTLSPEDNNGDCYVIVKSPDDSNFTFNNKELHYTESLADIDTQTTVSGIGSSYRYTGSQIKPTGFTVYDTVSGVALVEGTDYTVTYGTNTDIGEGTITLTGLTSEDYDYQGYSGTKTITFKIVDSSTSEDISGATVTVNDTYTYDGTAKTPKPTVTYNGTTLTEGTDYTLSYDNNKNASTSAKVIVSGKGTYAGTKTQTFTIAARDISAATITATGTNKVYQGDNYYLSPDPVTVKDTALGVTLTYTTDYKYTAGNDIMKEIGTGIGDHSFSISGMGNYTGTRTVTFTVTPADLSGVTVTMGKAEYTGSEVEPKPTSVTFGNTTLTEGVDYEISGYDNNVNIGTNTATITLKAIEGDGKKFTGTATAKFTIYTNKKAITDATIKVSSQSWTGSQICPTPTVTYDETTLSEGTDYTVSYGPNINVGTGTVTITGMGDYAGSLTKSFTISKKSLQDPDVIVTVNKAVYDYTGETITPDITVTYNGKNLVLGTDYEFSKLYSDTGTYENISIVGTASSNFLSGSPKKIGTITIQSPSGSLADLTYGKIEDQYYTGSEIKPELIIKNGTYSLKEGTDYTATWSNNTDAGKATVELTGKGSYANSTYTLEFTILPKPMEDCTISDIAAQYYNWGDEVKPSVTVKNGTKAMTEGTDYSVEYDNNVDVTDAAEITITAKSGNYTGSVTKYFTINALSLANSNIATVTQIDSQAYTGEPIEPEVAASIKDNGTKHNLEKDIHYTISYVNNTELGTATATITGINNITGTVTRTFAITQKYISDCYIANIDDQLYTGQAIEPELTITNSEGSSVTLVKGTDYTVSYKDNTAVGNATVTITGAGTYYTGHTDTTFEITNTKINLEENKNLLEISKIPDQTYNFGAAVSPEFTLTYDGETLTAGTDYKYTIGGNTAVGTATIEIIGTGSYTGTVEYTFDIGQYDVSGDTLTLEKDSYEYTGKVITPNLAKLLTSDGSTKATTFTDFDISYGENTAVGTGTVTITPKTGGNCTGTAITAEFEITARSITGATVKADDAAYTGSEITPENVTVTLSDGTVVPSDSYTVSCTNNTDVGTATVTVTGTGNFTGTATGTFNITGDMSKAEVKGIPASTTYTGSAITFDDDISVTLYGKELTSGTDYEVSYSDNNKNVTGEGDSVTVTITGKGDYYTGSKTAAFTITAKSIEDDDCTVEDIPAQTYTGSAIDVTSDVVVKVGTTKLTAGTDYEVTCTNNINVTTSDNLAKATITGIGNYTGTVEKTFSIAKELIDITGAKVTVADGTYVYNFGEEIRPDVTVSLNGETLDSSAYTLSYSGNTAAGTATVTVKPADGYKASMNPSATFEIGKLDITSGTVTLEKEIYTYTGTAYTPAVTSVKTKSGVVISSDYIADNFDIAYTGETTEVGSGTVTVSAKSSSENFSGTAKSNFSIGPASLENATVTGVPTSTEYTPGGVKLTGYAVSVGGKTLTEGADYEVSYDGDTKAGTTATIKFSGIYNYNGSISKTFEITQADLSEYTVSGISNQKWTGSAITFAGLTVTDAAGNELTNDTDYCVSYDKNTDPTAAATVVIIGEGNYTGKITKTFSITRDVVSISTATVSTIAAQTYTGSAIVPAFTVACGGATLTKEADYTVSYSDNVNAGTCTITITGKGYYNGTKTTSFVINPLSVEGGTLNLADSAFTYTGSMQKPEIESITLADGVTTITDVSSFTVSYEGGTAAGTAQVTLTGNGNYTGSVSAEYTIRQADITDAVVTVSGTQTYTGSPLTPDVTVVCGGKTLTKTTDYTADYGTNNTNAGTVTVTVTGTGNYTGKATGSFTIEPMSIASASIEVASATYTGKAQEPALTVAVGGKTLTSSDYTASYISNTNAGTGSVTIKGQGNYTGEASQTFTISPMTLTKENVSAIAAQSYTGAKLEPEVTVSVDDAPLTKGTDYTVTYQNSTDATTTDSLAKAVIQGKGNYGGTVTVEFEIEPKSIADESVKVTGYETSVTYTGAEVRFSGLTVKDGETALTPDVDYTVTYTGNDAVKAAGETYVTISGIGNYQGSVKIEFSITQKDLNDCEVGQIESQTYDAGKALEPDVVITNGTTKLEKDKDYEITYDNNTNVTTAAEAHIKGIGNYTGTVERTFTIAKVLKPITNAVITGIDDSYTYAFGEAIKPEPTVTYDDTVLTKDMDYTLSYDKNVDVGTAKVTITGTGDYNKSVTVSFAIGAVDITKGVVSVKEGTYSYTGSAISPAVTKLTLTDAAGTAHDITDMTLFSASYDKNVNAGTANVTLTPTSANKNYTGTATGTYTIGAATLEGVAELTVGSCEYTGSALTPKVTVTYGTQTLVENTDYTVKVTDNVNVGNGTVTVTGKGNYSGTLTATFAITAKSISAGSYEIAAQTYTGEALEPGIEVTVDGVKLKDTDYTVTYSNNTNATTDEKPASAVITGKGNYTGTINATFDIAAKEIQAADVQDISSCEYDGEEQTPEITVICGGKTLTAGTDFSVAYSNNTEKSKAAKAVITGKGNYSGKVTKTFEICSVSIEKAATVTGVPESTVYTGDSITFDSIKLTKEDGTLLVYGTDYSVSYGNNINVTTDSSKAYVTISGMGNYGGSVKCEFAITPKDLGESGDCEIEPVSGQTVTGSAIEPEITVRDGDNALEKDVDYTVEYSNNIQTSEVSGSPAVITVTGKGNYKGTLTTTFTIAEGILDISAAVIGTVADQYYNFGSAITPDVTVTLNGKTLTKDDDYGVTYSSNTKVGTATVTVKGINQNKGEVSTTFKILPISITGADVTLESSEYTYSGAQINAVVSSITVTRNGVKTAVTDMSAFNVTCSNNTNVGTATVTVKAIDGAGYDGETTASYTISRASLEDAVVTAEDVTYTGEAAQPAVTVTAYGKTLTENVDYTVDYGTYMNVADSPVVTITGKGNYTGTATGTYAITAKKLNQAELTVDDAVYTGSGVTPDVTVSLDGVTLKSGTDYDVSYADNTNVTSGSAKATATVTGKGNYTGTAVGQFSITPMDISKLVIADIEAQTYDGQAVTPKLTIKNGTKTLTEGTDYTVTYSDNDKVTDKATAVIAGNGNYTGTKTLTFAIKAASIADADVGGVSDSVYTGEAIEFEDLKVSLDGVTLIYGTDYTVSYSNNTDATTTEKASVVITGKGNYAGTKTVTFDIVAKNIARCTVDAVGAQKYADGAEVKPSVVVRDGSRVLVSGTDYDVTYENNKDVTESAKAVITGKGNYKGQTSVLFAIAEESNIKDISSAVISDIEDRYYNFGEQIRPEITVTLGEDKLTLDEDYELVYVSNTDEGTATVVVNGINNCTGTKSTTFDILPLDVTEANLVLDGSSYEYTGSAIKPEISMLTVDREGVGTAVNSFTGFDVSYQNNTKVGTGTVKLTAKSGSGFTGSVSASFEITRVDMSSAVVDVENTVYTGDKAEPSFTVTLGGKTLTEGTDYTAVYSNNTNAGSTAYVTVTGTGSYSGTALGYFTIAQRDLSGATVTAESCEYTGAKRTPAVKVTLDGDILNDSDYTVSYSNNINATTDSVKATVTITGTGNYTGTASGTFEITPKDMSKAVIGDIAPQSYTGAEVRPEVSLTLGGVTLAEGTDYTLAYDNNIAASEKASVTATGKGNYTGSVSKTFAIKNTSIESADITGIDDSVAYTGSAITFGDISVTLGGKTLSEDVDYEIAYANNTNVGTATVTITGIGNYSGKHEKTFAITAKNLSKCTVDAIGGQKHTGSAITPTVTVRDGGKALTKDTDYTVSYSGNTEVSTDTSKAVVTITGKGNYTGMITTSFTIYTQLTDISSAEVSKPADQYYNFGNALTPGVTVTFGGKTLTEGTDYALNYSDNYEEGTATIVVQGINNNTGSAETTFEIKPIDITSGVISLDAASYPYTGTAVKPDIVSFTVMRDGKRVSVTDYTGLDITYSSNTGAGTGKVTITAVSEEGFTGSVSKDFTIVGATLDGAEIKVDDGVYTGSAVEPDYTVTLGGRTLVSGTDYKADFSSNVNVTDSAMLTITGLGNYSGSKTATFAIVAKKLTNAGIAVESAKYTGSAVTPAVTVTLDGMTLVEDKDYTVAYTDNVDVTTADSKASVVITGIGNYTGTAAEEFDITARSISLATVKDIASQTYTGSATTPTLTITDGNNTLKLGTDYTVEYKNNTAVTTSAMAVITGKGNYTGSVTKLYAIVKADISKAMISGVKDSVTYTGKEITFAGIKVTYNGQKLTQDVDYTVSYSANKSVTDSAKIKINGIGNYGGSLTGTFAITAKSIEDDDVYVSEIAGQVYSGATAEPAVTVTYGDVTLTEDVDYEVTYSGNEGTATKDSPATATITGKGNYAGTVTRQFTITENAVNISGAKIEAISDQEFAGKNITPGVKVTYEGEELVLEEDYKVSYLNNYNAGTATVYVTGYGDYVGTKTTTFAITKKSLSGFTMTLDEQTAVYTGKAVTPGISSIASSDGSLSLSDEDIAAMVVTYDANVNVGGNATVTATAPSKSNYTGSVSAAFTITAASLEQAVVTAEDCEYTGSSVSPSVTVTLNGVVLSSGDYTVSYDGSSAVGTATVTVNGKNNYTGSATGSYSITARSLKNCTVTCSPYVDYTGGAVTPTVTVTNGDLTLEENVDYVLSYDMNTDATAKAKVIITGKGNYKDSVTRYFAIERQSISGAVVTGITDKTFTGYAQTQNVTVTLDGEKLTQGTDYTVKYTNNVHAGTAAVTITGAGNYTDAITKSFVINRVDVSKTAAVTGIDAETFYSGKAVTFDDIKIAWGNITLKEGTDYTVSYSGNSGITLTKTGKASCTVKFAGDYKGSYTKQFRIKAFDISKATVTAIADKTYTGSAIKPGVTVKIGSTVVNAKEYNVTYSNNVNPGTATIKITGINNFYGTKTVTFDILPAAVSGLAYSSSTTSSVTVKWSKVTGATGYLVYRYDTAKKSYVKVGSTTGTSYTVSKLSSGTDYKIGIKAYCKSASGEQLESTLSAVNATTNPAAVSGLKCSSSTTSAVAVQWSVVTGATGYLVYRYDTAKKTYVKVGSTTKTSYTITGLSSGTDYKIAVKAYRKTSAGGQLDGALSTVNTATKPAAVSGLKYSSSTTSSVTVQWSAVKSATGYLVYRYDTAKKTYVKVGTTAKTTYTVSKLSSGTDYKIAVKAYRKSSAGQQEGALSAVNTATKPAAVSGLKLTGRTASKLSVSWNKVSGAQGYKVYTYKYNKSKKKYVSVASKVVTTNSFSKSKLSASTTYMFKVVAYRKLGNTYLWSAASKLSASTTPSAVKGLKVVSRSATTITLQWKKVSNADGYIVYRKTAKGSYKKIKTLKKFSAKTIKFVSSKLSAGATYTYKVVAYRSVGSSKVVNAGTVTGSTTTPQTPIVTRKAGKKKAALAWKKTKGASGYVVYMATSKKGTYKKVKTLSAKTTKYVKTGLTSGKTYYFKIKAYKTYKGKKIYSSYSTVRAVKVK